MGEYAIYNGESVKIGTCEDMYYLRHDQRHAVTPQPGSVDPAGRYAHELRFRFPFPDEDGTAPGAFDGAYDRAIPVWRYEAPIPAEAEHYSLQFSAHAGYLVSLPCPESAEGAAFAATFPVVRNGFRGRVLFGQQKPTEDGKTLRLILRCGGCGTMWRAETWAEAEPVVVACRSEGDAQPDRRAWWHALADRIAAGYGIDSAAAAAS